MRTDALDHRPVLLSTRAEDPVEPPASVRRLGLLWPHVRPHLRFLVLALLFLPLAAAGPLVQPYLVKLAIDGMVVEQDVSAVVRIVPWFVGLIVFEFLAMLAHGLTLQLAGLRIMRDIRAALFRHVQGLPMAWLDRQGAGDLVTRMTSDVNTLGNALNHGALLIAIDVIMVIGIVVFMFVLEWRLALCTLAAFTPFFVVILRARRRLQSSYHVVWHWLGRMNSYLSEQVRGIRVVQGCGREDDCAAEYGGMVKRYRRAFGRANGHLSVLSTPALSIAAVCIGAVLLYAAAGSRQTAEGDLVLSTPIGLAVAFFECVRRLAESVRQTAEKVGAINQTLPPLRRIIEVLAEQPLDRAGQGAAGEPDPEAPAVELDDVTFAYPGRPPALSGASLRVGRREKVALIGATGAGKTTIVALAMAFYACERGTVRVLGRDVNAWEREALRRRIAFIPQEPFLWAGTVLDNVAPGAEPADRARAEQALRAVGASRLVRARGGLDARVLHGGANLSPSERQLIAFARALYRDAPILLIDEATAHVDSETESRLQAALVPLLEDRAAIIIAHRLSTIRGADRILVLQDGAVVEEGKHEDLLAADGVYARLLELHYAVRSDQPPAASAKK